MIDHNLQDAAQKAKKEKSFFRQDNRIDRIL